MSPSPRATYRISEADYVAAGALFARWPRSYWRVVRGLLIVAAALMVWNPSGIRGGVIGAIVGAVAGGASIRYLLSPWMQRRHYRQYKAMHGEMTVQQLDDGVLLGSPVGDVHLTWDKVLKWRENARYILIYPMPSLYYLVPRQAVAAQGFDVPALQAALREHVGVPV
ncbi:MAG: YcxB family protein [Pseudomonadota bacterium]|nr:YcxB family protein [Pseudomonadota bacterium]